MLGGSTAIGILSSQEGCLLPVDAGTYTLGMSSL